MTIMFRDFVSLIDKKTRGEFVKNIWTLSVQNLTYIMPFYQERILFASDE